MKRGGGEEELKGKRLPHCFAGLASENVENRQSRTPNKDRGSNDGEKERTPARILEEREMQAERPRGLTKGNPLNQHSKELRKCVC